MSVVSTLAEINPPSECQCANEPTVCNQYSTDNTCIDRLPNLASPLDEMPDIIAKKYDYYSFGSEWTATYCGGKPKRHVGVDLGVEFVEGKDIPVYAAASGQVKAAYPCSSSYNWAKGIVIDHDGAFTTVYEHINPLVSVGQHVDKGQQIATVAEIEGYQHLHFGIKCGGYEAISTRGALPVEHGPCDKKTDCSTSGCRCDPLFPGPFIDPLDERIVYEQHIPPQETIQSQSPPSSLNLDRPTTPIESALSTTPMSDGTHPVVQAFQVTLQGLTKGESFTVDYTVSDTGGSGLNRVELWRKDGQSDWQEIKRDALSGGDGPISGSFLDVPSNSGKYWYGIHVADNAGNWNDEKNSNSDSPSVSYEPVEVIVTSQDPVRSSIVGEWTLHSRRASDFIPTDSTITFYSNHNLFDSSYGTGTWRQNGNTIYWEYDLCGEEICTRFKTTYEGTIDLDMKGKMQTCDGEKGDWSADRLYADPGIMA